MAVSNLQLEGLPHSDIFGSTLVCSSPKLFAAYHVLHRLPMPRHPPHALTSLTIIYTVQLSGVLISQILTLFAVSIQIVKEQQTLHAHQWPPASSSTPPPAEQTNLVPHCLRDTDLYKHYTLRTRQGWSVRRLDPPRYILVLGELRLPEFLGASSTYSADFRVF